MEWNERNERMNGMKERYVAASFKRRTEAYRKMKGIKE